MSCEALIYTYNPSPQTVTLTEAQPTAILGLGTSTGFNKCALALNGNAVRMRRMGFFSVDTNVVLTAPVAGDYTVALYKDGVAVPGAFQTVTAAAAAAVAFNVVAAVDNTCCGSFSDLQLVLSTTAALPATVTVNNAAMTVEKA